MDISKTCHDLKFKIRIWKILVSRDRTGRREPGQKREFAENFPENYRALRENRIVVKWEFCGTRK